MNILITTMSDLSLEMKQRVNYYFSESGMLCTGISKLEAGSKYFLSNYPIDLILCVGNAGYEFYRSRINKFNLGIEEIPSSVSKDRQDYILSLIDSILSEEEKKYPEKWFSYFLENEEYFQCLVLGLQAYKGSFIGNLRSLFDKNSRYCSDLDFAKSYLYSLSDCRMKSMNSDVEWVCVEDSVNIVEELHSLIPSGRKANIFLDLQGGSRGDAFVQNALLSILSNEKDSCIASKRIVSTCFEPCHLASKICDETMRYSISDLVSGMNMFLRYGKADMIKEYLENNFALELSVNPRISKILSLMQTIDVSLSLCDVDSFSNSIVQMRELFNQDVEKKSDSLNSLFAVLESGIKKDYSILIHSRENSFILNMIQWALDKGFIQQAFTIIESKMPYQFVEDGVFYYGLGLGRQDVIELFAKDYSDDWKTDDMDHFFVRYTYTSFLKRFRSNRDDILRVNSLCEDFLKLEKLYGLYEKICIARNYQNHANSTFTNYDNAIQMVRDFKALYEEILVDIRDKTPLRMHISKEEVRKVWLRNRSLKKEYYVQERNENRPGEAYLLECLSYFKEVYEQGADMSFLKEIRKLSKSKEDEVRSYFSTLNNLFKEIKNMDKCWDSKYGIPRSDVDFEERFPFMRKYILFAKNNPELDRKHIYSLFYDNGGSRWLERMIQRPDKVMKALGLDEKMSFENKFVWKN
ncbi:MAG: TM1812 family CRISPR-associated protein [Bacillota bacterium]|nr:TM1812 family CRISPR-associated protein [Bacillota bacterium]